MLHCQISISHGWLIWSRDSLCSGPRALEPGRPLTRPEAPCEPLRAAPRGLRAPCCRPAASHPPPRGTGGSVAPGGVPAGPGGDRLPSGRSLLLPDRFPAPPPPQPLSWISSSALTGRGGERRCTQVQWAPGSWQGHFLCNSLQFLDWILCNFTP